MCTLCPLCTPLFHKVWAKIFYSRVSETGGAEGAEGAKPPCCWVLERCGA